MKREIFKYALGAMLAAVAAVSCTRYYPEDFPVDSRKVFILYADGFSNLTPYMRSDIRALCEQAPLKKLDTHYKLLVFSHLTEKDYNYNIQSSPILEDIYLDDDGNLVRDTLVVYPKTSNTASPEMVREVLTYVHNRFPAGEYGLVFSSHGTGWLPEGYYDSDGGSGTDNTFQFSADCRKPAGRYDYLLHEAEVKSIGCQGYYSTSGELCAHEIEVPQFADALPMHFKYIIMDACLMGGVETVYQLRDKADYVVSSQTEVLAGGFYYENMLAHVLYAPELELEDVCREFVDNNSSATVSLADCSQLGQLQECCAALFSKYREGLAKVNSANVQRYFRYNHHWYYDLHDIMLNVPGMEYEDLESLDLALEKCILYKDATKYFMSAFEIRVHCGLSMYLPANGNSDMDAYYPVYDWNDDTGLVLPIDN